MKFLSIIILTLFTQVAFAKTYLIGISPYMDANTHKVQSKALLQFLTRLPAEDKALIFDAYAVKQLGEFTIPVGKAYQNPKARLIKNGALAKAIMTLPKTVKGNSKRPTVNGAIRFPQFMRYLAENFSDQAGDVVVIGSALYDSPKDHDFYSMAQGMFPSDGHITASRDLTLFGTKDTPQLLKSWRVHWVIDDQDIKSDRHDHAITRFWTLYIEAQKGELISFVPDFKTVMGRVQSKASKRPHQYKLQENSRVEMIRLGVDELAENTPIYDRNLSVKNMRSEQLANARKVEVGLTWLGEGCRQCDLDLYARPKVDAPVLYFARPRTSDGVYFKDLQQAPDDHARVKADPRSGFETIAFTKPIDLRKLVIAVGFYSGHAPKGVKGEIRITVDGETYAKPIHLKATQGTGTDAVSLFFDTGKQNVNMLVINPLEVIRHE